MDSARRIHTLLCACILSAGATGLFATPAAAVDPAAGEYDWGFLASSFEDPNGDLRTRALGPVFESTRSQDGREFLAVRPAYARVRMPEADRSLTELFWPVGAGRTLGTDRGWRFLTAFYADFDTTDDASRYRFMVIPFYFQGRDIHGESYLALFPLGGTIHEFLRMDRIAFVLFPLWARNTVNDVTSRHWLWPVYSETRGEGVYRFRVFPFYGQSRFRDRFNKKFVLWPFYTSAVFSRPESSGTGYIVWPVWGHIDLTNEETWYLLPPLFKWARGQRQNLVHAPWPIIQLQEGSVEKQYLFPLWGKKTLPGSHSTFFLWPVFRRDRIDKGDSVYHRFLAVPFVYSDVYRLREPPPEATTDVSSRYLKLWPLFSYRREDDARRTRIPDLSPWKAHGPIERSYAPFWTLYSRTGVGEHVQSELLWGLYRHHRNGEHARYLSVFPLFQYRTDRDPDPIRSFSILKGLVGYRRSGELRRYQALWVFRWGDSENQP